MWQRTSPPVSTAIPKGLYKKARTGEIRDFTGISAPYEAPENPDIVIDTGKQTVKSSVDELIEFVVARLGMAAMSDLRGS